MRAPRRRGVAAMRCNTRGNDPVIASSGTQGHQGHSATQGIAAPRSAALVGADAAHRRVVRPGAGPPYPIMHHAWLGGYCRHPQLATHRHGEHFQPRGEPGLRSAPAPPAPGRAPCGREPVAVPRHGRRTSAVPNPTQLEVDPAGGQRHPIRGRHPSQLHPQWLRAACFLHAKRQRVAEALPPDLSTAAVVSATCPPSPLRAPSTVRYPALHFANASGCSKPTE